MDKDTRDRIADVFERYGVTEVWFHHDPFDAAVFSSSPEDYARLNDEPIWKEICEILGYTCKVGALRAGCVEGWTRLRPRAREGGGGYARRGFPDDPARPG